MKFRKKPVVVEAVQVRWLTWHELCAFLGDIISEKNPGKYGDASDACGEQPPFINLSIPTSEGVMLARHGDWIIKGVKGEFYPCKPDIFKETYEPVVEAAGEENEARQPVGEADRREENGGKANSGFRVCTGNER